MATRLQGMRRPYLGAFGVCSVCLCQLRLLKLVRRRGAYQGIDAEDVLAYGGEFERCDADFPAVGATVDFGTQSAAYDLVAKADAQDTDARLRLENLLCEVD